MPTPTPPKPGEEPNSEADLYRYHFRRLITWYLEALDPLPEAAFAWQPAAREGNSLRAICVHAIASAEWWVLGCVRDGAWDRDSQTEFRVETTWQELRPRFVAWLEQVETLLAGMSSEQLGAISKHPAGDRMNRRCMSHVIEHLGLHLGHVEVTCDWWRASQESV